jgi:hypothetical protein
MDDSISELNERLAASCRATLQQLDDIETKLAGLHAAIARSSGPQIAPAVRRHSGTLDIGLTFLFVRDLFRKPATTFRDHALASRHRRIHRTGRKGDGRWLNQS